MIGYDVVIVGAGHAGCHAAASLRQQKFAGSIALISDEQSPPYERPPLSKDYLSSKKTFDRLLLRPASFWQAQDITLLLGQRVASIEPSTHEVILEDGRRIQYRQLIWAAGGRPRRLGCDGADLAGVHTLRTRADADRIRQEVDAAGQVVIAGGGYLGLEVAATLREAGKQVTVIEAAQRVLARVAGEELSRFYEEQHRERGVVIRLGACVTAIEGHQGRACGVRLSDGERLAGDLIVVAIGISPETEVLRRAGAAVSNGVLVDNQCRTNLPDVFAIGDCALHVNAFASEGPGPIRLESVQNATDQAVTVARVLAGQPAKYDAIPWFWSNQYDLRLQSVGLSAGFDTAIVRGEPQKRAFSIVYLNDGRVIALDCVNTSRDYMQGRALVRNRVAVDPNAVRNFEIPLTALSQSGTQEQAGA